MENITSKGTIFGTLIAQAGPKGDTGKTGDRGLTGEAGYSPVKGIDYFTQEDISEIRKGIEGDLTGEYNKNAIEKTNIFNTNAKETTTSFDLNAENKTKEYNDNALAEIEKYNSNAIEKSNNFDTNFENKTSKFDSNYDEKTKEFNDNNDLGIQNYNNNAKKQMEIFDANFTEKLEAFNNNAGTKFNGFNTNSDKALAEYNKNHTAKMKEFDDNYDTKTKTFDDNAAAKIEAYNANDKAKTEAYNNNASNKEETFNTNAADKQNEFDENASDKLAEYNQNAKELINKVEQVQAKNEALKSENKLIKEQIPSSSVSGNSIHVEDSGTLDFEWKIRGGHKQETREGYNLLDLSNLKDETSAGISRITEEGKITLNGTPESTSYNETIYTFIAKESGVYTLLSFKKTAVSSIRLIFKVNDGQFISNDSQTQISLNENDVLLINLRIDALDKITNFSLQPMLYLGTDIKPFEQYGASPSPNYPSEVETVGSNVNYFDENTVESKFLNSKTGRTSDNASWRCTDFIEILSKQYNFSWESDSEFFQVTVCYYDKNKTFISGNEYELFGIYSKTFEIPDGANYMKVAHSITVAGKPVIRDKIKLEIGNKRTLYSPYMCGSAEIDVVNDNLFDINSISYGDLDTATGKKINDVTNIQHSDYIEVFPNENYTINFNNTLTKRVFYLDKNKNVISTNTVSTKIANFNTNNNIKYFRVKIVGAFDSETKLEKGLLATSFTEQQSQTAITPIQQEMLSGDYVADVEHHEWKKIVLTGNEEWAGFLFDKYAFTLEKVFFSDSVSPIWEKSNIQICSHFKVGSPGYDIENTNCFSINNAGVLVFQYEILKTVEEWKAYLKQQYEAGTPVTIYYKLAEPLNLELTSEQKAVREQKLYTYKNITNISVSDELASIDVTYKKDLETEHNKLQNEIDEIKQLISTTETSALLLDNLQKDVEMEVE